MSTSKISCQEMDLKMMALLDAELPNEETLKVQQHLDSCKTCQKKYQTLSRVKEVTGEMKYKKMPEMFWDEYWQHVYNKIERGIDWILISVGTIIVFMFLIWNLVEQLWADEQMHPALKTGVFILLIGTVILLISIVREKIMVRRVDKYREIER